MFYYLVDFNPRLNVFRYTTFRMAWALITALLFCYFLYPPFIRWMKSRKLAQIIREDGPQAHLETKVGTPTMGGVPMIFGVTLSSLLWCRLDSEVMWVSLFVLLGYGMIGFVDDWKKVMLKSSDGLSGRWKLVWQSIIAIVALGYGYQSGLIDPFLQLPFSKDSTINFAEMWPGAPNLSWGYLALGVFILVGTSNAVNLTDGLDGLAIGPIMTSAATFGILAYVAGYTVFAGYLHVQHVPGASELTVMCMAVVGAGLGFLWYNAYPAQIFMGDVGSLGLGGFLAVVAVLVKQELLLVLVGGIFVLEALSVIIQVVSFKTRGKRVFAMAPIHHHYEKMGWSEPKIIVRFWIISILLALVALTTLKLR
jgi:phospho-N-acetylmuramoyl-pentapeptide-transferase